MPTVLKAAAVLDVDKGRVVPDGFVLAGRTIFQKIDGCEPQLP